MNLSRIRVSICVAVTVLWASSALLAQYISFNIAPGGIGDPGPLQYLLSTHTIEHLEAEGKVGCPVEEVTAIPVEAKPDDCPPPATTSSCTCMTRAATGRA